MLCNGEAAAGCQVRNGITTVSLCHERHSHDATRYSEWLVDRVTGGFGRIYWLEVRISRLLRRQGITILYKQLSEVLPASI